MQESTQDTLALQPAQINRVTYFHPDISSRMVERAKKEHILAQGREALKEGKDGKESERGKVDHLGKAGRIVEELIRKHGIAKEKISKLKEEASKQSERECSFKPQHISGDKWVFRGDIIQRNQIWLQEKKRKQIERKEEALVSDLEHCTFSPEIASRRMSQLYLKNKSNHTPMRDKAQPGCQQTPSPLRSKKDISLTQFESAKKQIKNRLFTIALRN